jgi:phage baseplate assembly protein gpV
MSRAANILANQGRLQALMALGMLGRPHLGLITSYDPEAYAAKVMLQPEETETGWLPISTPMAGNGWGVYFGPSIGDQCRVDFQEGDKEVGFITGFLASDADRPPVVQSGQIVMVVPHGLEIIGEVSITGSLDVSGNVTVGNGASGLFTSEEGQTITVQDGITTNID